VSSPHALEGINIMFSHQAPIAPGSSGGALVRFTDAKVSVEEIVGVNSQVGVLGRQLVSNIGYSIKSSVIEKIVAKLESEHVTTHAFLGAVLTDPLRANPNVILSAGGAYPPAHSGIVVTKVFPGSPAQRSGLADGDIITKFEAFVEGQWFEMQSAT